VVVVVYIVIPSLIALHQISNILLKVLFATLALFIAELIVSFFLLKISRPTRTPSVIPQRYQPVWPVPVNPLLSQVKTPNTGYLSSRIQRPSTPIPTLVPAPQFIRVPSTPIPASVPAPQLIRVPSLQPYTGPSLPTSIEETLGTSHTLTMLNALPEYSNQTYERRG